jgi:integrase
MPKYGWDVKEHLLYEEEVKQMYDLCKNDYERLAISIMWMCGPRPTEMIELISKKVTINETKIDITLKTLKLGRGGDFKIQERNLSFKRPSGLDENIYLETIAKMVRRTGPEEKLLPYSVRWAERLTNRVGIEVLGKPISPYHFRHSCLTWLVRLGASVPMAMHFKGSEGQAVNQYFMAQPFVVGQELLRRGQQR